LRFVAASIRYGLAFSNIGTDNKENLMGVFLKMIGSGKSPCPEPYAEPFADFSPSRPPNKIHIGDHLILYAAGGRKRVFAIARVTSEGYASDFNEGIFDQNPEM